jgi:hypothetical protein
MHYVISQGTIIFGAVDFTPGPPYSWHPEDVVGFQRAIFPVDPFLRFASLLAADGTGWGIDIDASSLRAQEEGCATRVAVMHRISGNQQAKGAVVGLARRMADGQVTLYARNYLPEDLERVVATVLRAGGRPIVHNDGECLEATIGQAGVRQWVRRGA